MSRNAKQLVKAFLEEVRSGVNPQAASKYLAPMVRANQVVSEANEVVVRTPEEYAQHVFEMKAEYGDFEFSIDELISDGDKVYARWTQLGKGIRQVTSCVYRIENNLIAEYWIQIDRLGLQFQKNYS
jgi:predicted ester cyclase